MLDYVISNTYLLGVLSRFGVKDVEVYADNNNLDVVIVCVLEDETIRTQIPMEAMLNNDLGASTYAALLVVNQIRNIYWI